MTRLVTQEKEQGAQHSGSSAIKETWALQGTKQIEAVRQDYGLLYVNFCPMHAVVHPPDYKCPGAPEPTREVSPRVWGRFAKNRAKSAPPQRVALIALAHRHLRTAVRERDAAHMPLPASAK